MTGKTMRWPPPPPSTRRLHRSEPLWEHGEAVRCIAQCLEAGCVPREVWNRLAQLNEAWDRLLAGREYGVQYDADEVTAAAIGFFVDRWAASRAGESSTAELQTLLLPVLDSPTRRDLWNRGVGASVYELVPVRPRPAGQPPAETQQCWARRLCGLCLSAGA